jgi:very-short-patch-repair endonuclease
MPTSEAIRKQIEKFASDFYSQALNLTLSNPLLRLPESARSTQFLEFDESHMRRAIGALVDEERAIAFVGEDASAHEQRLAESAMRQGSRETLRLDVPLDHEKTESVLRILAKRHEELLEKRGLPCAYVGVGFLKWIPEDGKPTWAPLLLIPVEIERALDPKLLKTVITLRLSERDACENPVLREYLKAKYDLRLPAFEYPSEPSLSKITDWLENAERITATKSGWALEEGGVFGLFDCGAIAADCDPKNWTLPLHERDLILKFFLSTHNDESKPGPAPFIPDSLVLPADGSQLEALQHAATGTNIVLHGPPGSGKSQTIVNLVAQALAAGKSVLFVAQKPEAAHVVHRRLAECGLAPFCSMLVPVGASQNIKAAMLEGLRTRETLRLTNAGTLRAERDQLNQHIDLLESYARALPISLPSIEVTARDALAELAVHSINQVPAVELEELVQPSTVTALNAAKLSLLSLARLRTEISDHAFAAIGGLRPLNDKAKTHEAAFTLIGDLKKIVMACQNLTSALDAVQRLGLAQVPRSISELRSLHDSAPPSIQLADETFLARAYRLRRKGASRALQELDKAQSLLREVKEEVHHCRSLVDSPAIPDERMIREIGTTLERYGLSDLSVTAAQSHALQLDALRQAILALDSAVSPGPVAQVLARVDGFATWQHVVRLLEYLSRPDAGRTFLLLCAGPASARLVAPPSLDQVRVVQQQAERVSKLRDDTRIVCLAERLPSLTELRVTQSAIAARSRVVSRTIGLLTDKRYRYARRVAYTVLLPGVRRAEWSEALASCIALVEAERDWQSDAGQIGAAAAAIAEPARWRGALEWYQATSALSFRAKVSSHAVWGMADAFEQSRIDAAEQEALQAASRVADSETLSKGLADLFPTSRVTPVTIADALGSLVAALRRAASIATALGSDDCLTVRTAVLQSLRIAQLRTAIAAVEGNHDLRQLLADEYRGIDSNREPYQLASDWLGEWSGTRRLKWAAALDWLFADAVSHGHRGASLQAMIDALRANLPTLKEPLLRIASGFTFNGAARALRFGEHHTLGENSHSAEQILRFESSVPNIFDFGLQATICANLAGHGIIERFMRGEYSVDQLPNIYRRGVLEQALREFERTAPLLEADRGTLEAALAGLPGLDEQIRKSNSRLLIQKLMDRTAPAGRSSGLVREYTERGYIRHLIGLQRPRFEVQDLFRRSKNALRVIQPCVIATPSSASEYLPRDSEVFDLLIMDEASQVTPASALGSIARAKQAIIVGDPQQLPPTTFFMGSNQPIQPSQDDDSEGVTNVESILERAISALCSVHLRGHYRSRHHSLISFSNKHFYDKRLITTLSVGPRDSKLGIIAHHIKDGRYSSSTNEKEAIAVAKGVMAHLRSGSNESIGIVAFNAPQAELIETHLETLARSSKEDFDAYARARQAKAPLFIRNLESVQGDERDVIFISYTYGPDVATGVVAQRFGPILQAKGERRLNVLVTRAKNRVEVFHSLLPTDIVASARGAQIMRAYLEHALQTPEFDTTTVGFESDFEEEVARAIERIDPRLDVRPQVGCDGFRIDLGVSLKSNPTRFILGVECDGATFHGTQHARDRDLIRQTILEHHGWTIHRVWSTAWWKNAPYELERLTNAVREAMGRETVGR